MSAWHPLSKLVVGSGLVAVGWLVVTGPEAPATVAAVRARLSVEPARPTPGEAVGALVGLGQQLDLPPRESFRAALERPLFAPSRRPAARPEPAPAEEPATAAAVGRSGPSFRLVGTVSRRGRTEALVELDGGDGLERVTVGEEIDGWHVTEIGIDRLVVERDGEQHRLLILR